MEKIISKEDLLKHCIRVGHKPTGKTGLGLLLKGEYILTCLHNIISDENPFSPIQCSEIRIDLYPYQDAESLIVADSIMDFSLEFDYAVIKLSRKLQFVKPAAPVFVDSRAMEQLADQSVKTFLLQNGNIINVEGRYTGLDPRGFVQIDPKLNPGMFIDSGASGSPVWCDEKKGVIGIVKSKYTHQAKTDDPKARIAYAIPFSKFSASLKLYDLLPDSKVKPFSNFIPREELYNQIVNALESTNSEGFGLAVILGEKGVGKSSIAKYYLKNCGVPASEILEFDCLCDFAEPQEQNFKIGVIENLHKDHPIMKRSGADNWFTRTSLPVVCITNDLAVAERVCQLRSQFQHKEKVIISVGNLSIDETSRLTSLLCNCSDTNMLKYVFECSEGNPMLIQLITDLFMEGKLESDAIDTLDSKQRLDHLLDFWINLREKKARDIIVALSCIPFHGMSEEALFSITDVDINSGKRILNELALKRGLIVRGHRNILIVHRLFKDHFSRHETKYEAQIAQLTKRYSDYLKSCVNFETFQADMITFIDAWTVGIRSIFRKPNDTWPAYKQRVREHKATLEKMLTDEKLDHIVVHDIAGFLKANIQHGRCDDLIFLGYVMSSLKPNLLIAETFWSYTEKPVHYDAWAASCCIYTSINHWIGLAKNGLISESRMSTIIEKMKKWVMTFWMKEFASETHYTHDFEVAIIVGGLCELGKINEAEQLVAQLAANLGNRYYTLLVDLVIVIRLFDAGQKERAFVALEKNWQRVADNQAKQMVSRYIRLNTAIRPRSVPDFFNPQIKISQTLAKMARSESFMKFAHSQGCPSDIILTIDQ